MTAPTVMPRRRALHAPSTGLTTTARLVGALRLARLAIDVATILLVVIDRLVAPPDVKPRSH